MFVSRINTTVARKLKIVLFKIYTIFSINIDMVCFSVLLHLYINRNISEIVSNKINLYMTLLVEGYNMQIMPEVFILGCIYALPAYRDLMRAEGPKHIPIF